MADREDLDEVWNSSLVTSIITEIITHWFPDRASQASKVLEQAFSDMEDYIERNILDKEKADDATPLPYTKVAEFGFRP